MALATNPDGTVSGTTGAGVYPDSAYGNYNGDVTITGVGQTGTGTGTSANSGTNNSAPAPGGIIAPLPTEIVPNPLHQFASWTYNWSLWWLDVGDYNTLIDADDAGPGLTMPLSNSYVIAEQGSLYANQRMPTQLGLNYSIEDVEFTTVVGLNSKSKSSNMTDGTMTILEPMGVTFVDSLVRGTQMLAPGNSYTNQPYMLQLDFVGYDDAGNPQPANQTTIYRKRFPISISGVNISVSNKGAQYDISYYATGHEAYTEEYSTIPKNITVTAGTVGDFFTIFSAYLNAFLQEQAAAGKRQYADTIAFNIDPNIAISKIAYSEQMSLAQGDPNSTGIDLSKGTFNLASGTQIVDIINRVLGQSEYLIGQLGLNLQSSSTDQIQTSLTQILNTFKTTVKSEYAGADSSGNITNNVFDNVRNTYPKKFTYSILQYSVYEANHPAAPLLTDSRPFISKAYNYIYTGKNIDIIDFKINFDTSWYSEIMAYTDVVASNTPTASTGVDAALANSPTVILSPQLLMASGVLPSITSLMPLRYKIKVNDQRDTIGMNIINNPAAQTSVNMLRSLYSQSAGDMLQVDLQIVGDPTLLKQDDWLYSPDPTSNGNYFSGLSQSNFAQQYGHIQMDNGMLVASLTINTPLDNDTDWTNSGLVFPQPGTYPSLFNGNYKIQTIKNTFTGGKFEQTLSMVRFFNNDIVNSSAPDTSANGRSSVSTSQSNQNSTNLTQAQYTNAVQTLSANQGAVGSIQFNQTQTAIQTLTTQYNQQYTSGQTARN